MPNQLFSLDRIFIVVFFIFSGLVKKVIIVCNLVLLNNILANYAYGES